MKLLKLALGSLINRRWAAVLTVLAIAVSVCLLLGVERARTQAREAFLRTVSDTDLIVGARSGPINLLLYSVFHLGDATNNVSWRSYEEIARMPQVAWTVPLSLGDSHRGFRVLGTSTAFFDRYHYSGGNALTFKEGGSFSDLYDAVIGTEVARSLGYRVGDRIVVAHGTARVAIAEHDDQPFRVSGILADTGTPVDRSVLVSVEAIEAIHVDWRSGIQLPDHTGVADIRKMDLTPRSITAFLVGLHSRATIFGVQRAVNEYEDEALLAILPGATLQQLWRLMGVAERTLLLISALVVVAGLIGMAATLVTALSERRREMAILRALGARVGHVFGLLILEAGFLTACGAATGLALLYAIQGVGGGMLADRFGLTLSLNWPAPAEWCALGLVLVAGLLAGTIPAALAYRRSLADGLTMRI